MQIPVNKNMDEYKDDFFKGLTFKQTMICIAALGTGIGVFLFFYLWMGLGQNLSVYLTLPFVFPIAASGFLKIGGMGPREYFQKKKVVRHHPIYYYSPQLLKEKWEEHKEVKDRNVVIRLGEEEEYME